MDPKTREAIRPRGKIANDAKEGEGGVRKERGVPDDGKLGMSGIRKDESRRSADDYLPNGACLSSNSVPARYSTERKRRAVYPPCPLGYGYLATPNVGYFRPEPDTLQRQTPSSAALQRLNIPNPTPQAAKTKLQLHAKSPTGGRAWQMRRISGERTEDQAHRQDLGKGWGGSEGGGWLVVVVRRAHFNTPYMSGG